MSGIPAESFSLDLDCCSFASSAIHAAPPLASLRVNSIGSIRARTRGKAYAVDLWIGLDIGCFIRGAPRRVPSPGQRPRVSTCQLGASTLRWQALAL